MEAVLPVLPELHAVRGHDESAPVVRTRNRTALVMPRHLVEEALERIPVGNHRLCGEAVAAIRLPRGRVPQ